VRQCGPKPAIKGPAEDARCFEAAREVAIVWNRGGILRVSHRDPAIMLARVLDTTGQLRGASGPPRRRPPPTSSRQASSVLPGGG
jgi:hypothetical protein